MPEFIKRMEVEVTDLTDKIHKLEDFMCSPKYAELNEVIRELMTMQIQAMVEYKRALNVRFYLMKAENGKN